MEALLTRAGAGGLGIAPGREVYAVFKANSVRLL
ncbi:MAG: TOBE domain-containing protein [Planctomycetes bacterium]|nr:TOBE domain-containing protein [Planctomycetota bacterium]